MLKRLVFFKYISLKKKPLSCKSISHFQLANLLDFTELFLLPTHYLICIMLLFCIHIQIVPLFVFPNSRLLHRTQLNQVLQILRMVNFICTVNILWPIGNFVNLQISWLIDLWPSRLIQWHGIYVYMRPRGRSIYKFTWVLVWYYF